VYYHSVAYYIMQRISRRLVQVASAPVMQAQAAAFSSLAVKIQSLGDPFNAYKLETHEKPKENSLKPNEVFLKFLAAPINPADINIAQGVYGNKKNVNDIGGMEGVAKVEKVGSAVKDLSEGDWVLNHDFSLGTWTQFAQCDAKSVMKISNDIPIPYAATISSNPAAAYRMLRDFEKLNPGDVIIQNAPNSMVGLAVVQMAREMGVKTVNIVSDKRPNVDEKLEILTNLGGDINVTEDIFQTYEMIEILKELPAPKLALNCVGGEITADMCRLLAPGGTLVSYGNMSMKPIVVPEDVVAYKQLKLKGFWMSKWNETHTKEERSEMIEDIVSQIRNKQLSFFYEMHDFDDFDHALKVSQTPFQFRKVVLNIDYPDRFAEHDSLTKDDYSIYDVPYV